MKEYMKTIVKRAGENPDGSASYLQDLWGDAEDFVSENPKNVRTALGGIAGILLPYLLGGGNPTNSVLGGLAGAGLGRWGYPKLMEELGYGNPDEEPSIDPEFTKDPQELGIQPLNDQEGILEDKGNYESRVPVLR